MATFTKRIQHGDDDVSTFLPAHFSKTDDPILIGSMGGDIWSSAYRFPDVLIPNGATINSAKLTFIEDTGSANDIEIVNDIKGEAVADPARITSFADFAGRARTTATVVWTIPIGGVPGVGNPIDSADFTAIIQEIVSLGPWNLGDALIIFCDDKGINNSRRMAIVPYEDTPGSACLLTVEFTEPPSVTSSPIIVW